MATQAHHATQNQGFTDVATIRVDERGRLTLAKRGPKKASGAKTRRPITAYRQLEDEDGTIMLVPLVEMPAREAWVYDNPEILASIQRGLAQSAAGQGTVMDFSAFADEDE